MRRWRTSSAPAARLAGCAPAIQKNQGVETTEGHSFAEVEELKNLLVMRFMESSGWDWGCELRPFDINRSELAGKPPRRQVGFGVLNGNGE